MFLSKPEVLQALNIVVGYYPKTSEETIPLGSNKHFNIDPSSVERFDLGAGLEVLMGFFGECSRCYLTIPYKLSGQGCCMLSGRKAFNGNGCIPARRFPKRLQAGSFLEEAGNSSYPYPPGQ